MIRSLFFLGFVSSSLAFFQSHAQAIDTVRIHDTSVFPSNTVCQLEVERRSIKTLWLLKRTFTSTGFLIDKNTLLTNAHNVHSNFFSRVVSIQVNPGREDERIIHAPISLDGRSVVRENVRTAPEYSFMQRASRRAKNDYALVHLRAGALAQNFLPIRSADALIGSQVSLTIIGYPGPTKGGITNGRRQFLSKGPYERKDNTNLYYWIWTETGNSGSPVMLDENGTLFVVGIHAFPNKALRLDDRVITQIQQWRADFNSTISKANSK